MDRKYPMLLLLCLCAAAAGEGRAAPQAPQTITLTPAQVRTAGIVTEAAAAAAARGADGDGLQMPGQVVPDGVRVEVLLSTVGGQVEALGVRAGDTVERGQPLLRLRSAELAAMQRAYLEARLQDQLARDRLARDEALLRDGIIAGARLAETRTARELTRASELEKRRLLQLAGYADADIARMRPDTVSDNVALRARAAGIVLEVPVRAGQRVESGDVLARLSPPGSWWVELRATAAQAAQLAAGDAVRVAGCAGSGRITAIGAQVDSASQTVPVRAEYRDLGGCLRSNQYVQAVARPGAVPAGWVGVPAGALVRNAGRTYVFIEQRPGVFLPAPVEVARRQGARAWLAGGIGAGTRVAASGTATIKGAWLGFGAAEEGAQ